MGPMERAARGPGGMGGLYCKGDKSGQRGHGPSDRNYLLYFLDVLLVSLAFQSDPNSAAFSAQAADIIATLTALEFWNRGWDE